MQKKYNKFMKRKFLNFKSFKILINNLLVVVITGSYYSFFLSINFFLIIN